MMNSDLNFFDPKSNPFFHNVNSGFKSMFSAFETVPADSEKILAAQTKAWNVLKEVNHEYVECLRKIASGQGTLFADFTKRGSDFAKDYPYGKSASEQVNYHVSVASEVQKNVVKNMEDMQSVLEGATNRVKKIVADYSKEVVQETEATSAELTKKVVKATTGQEKKAS